MCDSYTMPLFGIPSLEYSADLTSQQCPDVFFEYHVTSLYATFHQIPY